MNTQQNIQYQQLKDGIDVQGVANRMNLTVYEYELSDNSIGRCFVKLGDENKWMLPTGDIVNVVKLVRTYEPETTGHNEVSTFFKGRYAKEIAEEVAHNFCDKWINASYRLEEKNSRRYGLFVRLVIINLTDQQRNAFFGEIS